MIYDIRTSRIVFVRGDRPTYTNDAFNSRTHAALTNILDRLSLARSYNVPVTSKPRMSEAVYNLSSMVWW